MRISDFAKDIVVTFKELNEPICDSRHIDFSNQVCCDEEIPVDDTDDYKYDDYRYEDSDMAEYFDHMDLVYKRFYRQNSY